MLVIEPDTRPSRKNDISPAHCRCHAARACQWKTNPEAECRARADAGLTRSGSDVSQSRSVPCSRSLTYSARAALSSARPRSRHQATSASMSTGTLRTRRPADWRSDCSERSTFPVLERVVEGFPILGELAQPRPALVRVPGEAKLCIAREPDRVSPASHRSDLLALVPNLQLELPTFEAHEHSAELLPRYLVAVDHEERRAAVFIAVPADAAAHQDIGDAQAN